MINNIIKILNRGDKRSISVKKNILATLVIKGCSIAISILLVPMTLGYVSAELYGIWLTLSSIMVWLNFFDIGFTLGLKNRLAESIALNNWAKGQSLVSTTYFMMLLIFIPICCILEMVIPHINWSSFLNISQAYNEQIRIVMHIIVACFCLQMIINVITAIIAAFQQVALSTIFPVLGNLISLLIITILTKISSGSLILLSIAISLPPIIITFIASIILFDKKYKQIRPTIKSIKTKYINDLFNLGSRFFLIQIQMVILYQSTNILISRLSGAEEVTTYNIAYKYLGIAMMIYTIILSPLWPAFTDAYTKKDFIWMKSIYKKMKLIFGLSTVGIILMILCSNIVYEIWIGEKISIPMMMTCTVGLYMLIYSWDALQVNIINGIGTIKLQSFIVLIGLIFHIPLSITLGKYIGAYGVLCSMIIINIIYSIVFTIQVYKLLNQKANGIWKS